MNAMRELISIGLCAMLCAGALVTLNGCGKGKEEVAENVPPPPPPPPAPAAPAVTPIEQLVVELNIDPRVRLPEDKAPDNNDDRKAVLVFFDAFARGDANAVKGMLPETDQRELAPLVESGVWKQTAAQIKAIDVQTGRNPTGNKCALAVIETGKGAVSNFQPQMWYYTSENDASLFEAAPTPPAIIDQLSGNDWIAAWHKILAEELALADKPDEEFEPPQKVLDKGRTGAQASKPPGDLNPGRTARPAPPTITAPAPDEKPSGR
jgi:hypothetical protein